MPAWSFVFCFVRLALFYPKPPCLAVGTQSFRSARQAPHRATFSVPRFGNILKRVYCSSSHCDRISLREGRFTLAQSSIVVKVWWLGPAPDRSGGSMLLPVLPWHRPRGKDENGSQQDDELQRFTSNNTSLLCMPLIPKVAKLSETATLAGD